MKLLLSPATTLFSVLLLRRMTNGSVSTILPIIKTPQKRPRRPIPSDLPRKTIESELIEQGTSEAHAKMVYQEHGFISTALFEEWCMEVFFTS
jgi:hypothetical protein